MTQPLRVLTLWQPWATLVACGAKRFETRSWATSYRGRVVIHAARTTIGFVGLGRDFLRDEVLEQLEQRGLELDALPLGKCLAIATLEACRPTTEVQLDVVEDALGDFTPGRFAWHMTGVTPLEPIPFRGGQGLRAAPAELVREIERQARGERTAIRDV